MEMWNKKEHDFGQVNHSTIQTVDFIYNGGKEVLEIEPLCNCVGYTFKDNILKLKWKVKSNPIKSYDSKKVIMIIYKDQTIDDLTLRAHILK